MEALLNMDHLHPMIEDSEIIGLMDPDETANVLRGLQDVIDKDIDIGPDDVNNNFPQTVVNNRIITHDDVNNSLNQSDGVDKGIRRFDDVLDSSYIGIGVGNLSKFSDRGSNLYYNTTKYNNLLDYKYSKSLSGTGEFAIAQHMLREPPEYKDVCSPRHSFGSNSGSGSGCSSQPERCSKYSKLSIEHMIDESMSESTNDINSFANTNSATFVSEGSSIVNKRTKTCIADQSSIVNKRACVAEPSSSKTESTSQSSEPDICISVNCVSVQSGVRRSARNKEYNLRTSSLINRVETEQRRKNPKKPKPKNKPAPLSKYRRKTANTRERSRMQEINDAFEELEKVVPDLPDENGKPTKITILQLAMNYISALREMLEYGDQLDLNCKPNQQGMDCTSSATLNVDDTSQSGQSMDCTSPGGYSNSSLTDASMISTDPDMTSVSICSPRQDRQRLILDSEGESCYSS